VRYKLQAFTVLVCALVTASCETTTSESGPGTLVTQIGITSPFVLRGDTLVGDTVVFVGRVTTGDGTEVPSAGLEFESADTTVVKILDTSSGRAAFRTVGSSEVTVRFDEPSFGNTTEKLEATIVVNVSQYDVELKLVSTITDLEVDTTEALRSDTVRVEAVITLNGDTVPGAGDVRVQSSSNPAVVAPVPPSPTDRAVFVDSGQARLRVTVGEPSIPGSAPLADSIGIIVVDFRVGLGVASLVPGSDHLDPNGDTLVTDSVQFRAFVITSVTDSTEVSGATWTSTNASAVAIRNAATGEAVFVGTGTADVQVDFTSPVVPVQTGTMRVPVSTLVVSDTLKSVFSGAVTDTLITDSVQVIPVVRQGGQPQPGVVLRSVESTDSSRVEIVDGPAGRIFFADTGSADLIVTIDEPDLPRLEVADTIPSRVTTYIASISGPGSAPTMGDTVQYGVTITETRGGTTLASFDRTFQSSNSSVIRLLNDSTGSALARDLGTATVSVRLDDPTLPDPTTEVGDSLAPTTISVERFYGTFSVLSGDFQDTVVVTASEVHQFTSSSEIRFPNGSSGYVDSVNAAVDSLWFVVGGGTNTGQLTLINLEDDLGGARDTVLSRSSFAGGGTVDDPFEPNDAFPLPDTAAVNLSSALPFHAFLSMDPARTVPSDTNFFWLSVPSGPNLVVDVRAETQQDADIDFFVCNGIGNPPTGYDGLACARDKTLNGSGRVEEEIGVSLGPGRHVIGFYCVSGCTGSDPIVTYKVRIE
jgi:hypothetical protein